MNRRSDDSKPKFGGNGIGSWFTLRNLVYFGIGAAAVYVAYRFMASDSNVSFSKSRNSFFECYRCKMGAADHLYRECPRNSI